MSLSSISEILESFAIGTDKLNITIPPTPSDNELLPLRQISKKSVVSKVKEKMNINKSKKLLKKKNETVTPSPKSRQSSESNHSSPLQLRKNLPAFEIVKDFPEKGKIHYSSIITC